MGEHRKLSRSMRKINLGYQMLMALLGAVNMVLIALNGSENVNIPEVYYEILSVVLAVLPVFWNNLLDRFKQYQEDLTPASSVDNTPPNSP